MQIKGKKRKLFLLPLLVILALAGLVGVLAGYPALSAVLSHSQDRQDSGQQAGTTAETTQAWQSMPPAASATPAGPSALPTARPTVRPTALPTTNPATRPTTTPIPKPTAKPTAQPTAKPTAKPTARPVSRPTPTAAIGDGVIYYRGFADPRTIDPEPVADPLSLTALVNKYYELPAGFIPPLVKAAGTAEKIQPPANEAWILLREACLKDTGVQLELLAGYRSYTEQKYLFQDAIRRKGIVGTVPYNALQGRSEHQLGLALDFNDGVCKDFSTAFAKTEAGIWLAGHAHQFGFILRYPAGKEKITNYAYEPWHYRYLGLDAAAQCHKQNWTLEEYVKNR